MSKDNKDFQNWMRQVDAITEANYGISVHDLPDMRFRDNFDDGVSPQEFFEEDVMEHISELEEMSMFF